MCLDSERESNTLEGRHGADHKAKIARAIGWRRQLSFVLLAAAMLAGGHARGEAAHAVCGQPGQWFTPGSGINHFLPPTDAFARLAGREVVLLGETHDSLNDHRWQYAMLNALYARQPDLAIGFEMFPRRVQPILDRWVRGELSEADFLAQADWDHVWDMDPRLYLPLFQFAREHRVPMLALNVESSLVKRIGAVGLDAVPAGQRQGVGQPAPLPVDYRDELKAIFAAHAFLSEKGMRFEHFMEAQQFKDRAMAEVIDAYRNSHPNALVVGILGAGHILNGHGVPQQLRALGQQRIAVLATWPANLVCHDLAAGYADMLFVVPSLTEPPGNLMARLGITLREAPEGLLVEQVARSSLGEKAGLRQGDILVQAAGRAIHQIVSAHALVQRQPAGTWLPLQVRRGGDLIEIVLRFPVGP